jgi:undecaprenyl pyrophosphate phosphatase UppP
MGMALGMSRTAAARFSFLLSIPIILGATISILPDIGTSPRARSTSGPVEIAAGMLAAGLSGYWAISTLLAVVQRRDLLGFARYVVVFGTVLLPRPSSGPDGRLRGAARCGPPGRPRGRPQASSTSCRNAATRG